MVGVPLQQTVKLDPADAPIDTLLKEHDGKRYLLAVNHSPEPVGKVTFHLPDVQACKSHFDGSARVVREGTSFDDEFDTYEVQMYELR